MVVKILGQGVIVSGFKYIFNRYREYSNSNTSIAYLSLSTISR